MTRTESRHVLALACIFACRMLGLFMVLPVLALYVKQLQGATHITIGLALGIYGFFQALLQIPLGLWSDRIGRKLVITLGLSVFALGSFIAAMSTTINGIIFGRALQGAGAVGSTILALTADTTRIEHRTQAMAIIGMMIGIAFFLAIIAGPIVNHWLHLSGIFGLTGLLALLGIIVLWTLVPSPHDHPHHLDIETAPKQILSVLKQPELLKLDLGIAMLHAQLTALFLALPIILKHVIHLAPEHQAYFYLPVAAPAFLAMLPFVIIAEKKRQMKPVLLVMMAALLIGVCLIGMGHNYLVAVAGGLFIFFMAFSALEALLPSLISKLAPPTNKGTAMGVYSSSQFLGIFIGGIVGGYLFQQYSYLGLFTFTALLGLTWLMIARSMQPPPHLSTRLVALPEANESELAQIQQQLYSIPGVHEVALMKDTGVAYLKVDNTMVQDDQLKQLIKTYCTSRSASWQEV